MELFGDRAGPAMAAVAAQGADALAKFTAQLEDSEGAARKTADALMSGFVGKVREFQGAWETLILTIAESGVLDMLTRLVTRAGNFVRELAKASPETLKWGTALTALTVAAGPVVFTMGLLASGLSNVINLVRVLTVGSLFNPITAAAIGLAGAAYLVYTNWEKIQPAWDRVAGAATRLGEALKPIWESINRISEALTGRSIGELFAGVESSVISAIADGLNLVATAINAIAAGIELISKYGGTFTQLMGLTAGGGTGAAGGIAERMFGTAPEPAAPGGGGGFSLQSVPGIGSVGTGVLKGAAAATPLGNMGAAWGLIDQFRGLVDDLLGTDKAASAAAAAPPTGGSLPPGITLQAEGPKVQINQAPPSITNNVTVYTASPDTAPAATGQAVGRAVGNASRAGMYDVVNE
jgi:hypothetical protein